VELSVVEVVRPDQAGGGLPELKSMTADELTRAREDSGGGGRG